MVDTTGDSLEVGHAESEGLVGYSGKTWAWARDRALKPRVAFEGLQMDVVAQTPVGHPRLRDG